MVLIYFLFELTGTYPPKAQAPAPAPDTKSSSEYYELNFHQK